MTRSKPKEKSKTELLILASKAVRIDEVTFMFPSETNESKRWYVNTKSKTCRDGDGNGCPSMFYYHNCKHLKAAEFLLTLLKQWIKPEERLSA